MTDDQLKYLNDEMMRINAHCDYIAKLEEDYRGNHENLHHKQIQNQLELLKVTVDRAAIAFKQMSKD